MYRQNAMADRISTAFPCRLHRRCAVTSRSLITFEGELAAQLIDHGGKLGEVGLANFILIVQVSHDLIAWWRASAGAHVVPPV
jgi:hypothetical protein